MTPEGIDDFIGHTRRKLDRQFAAQQVKTKKRMINDGLDDDEAESLLDHERQCFSKWLQRRMALLKAELTPRVGGKLH
jgi:hypothetical protein